MLNDCTPLNYVAIPYYEITKTFLIKGQFHPY